MRVAIAALYWLSTARRLPWIAVGQLGKRVFIHDIENRKWWGLPGAA